MAECKIYGCYKQAVEFVDMWGFCSQHAEEYKKRFAEALEAQQAKREERKTTRQW